MSRIPNQYPYADAPELVDLAPESLARPPDWRWQLARALVAAGQTNDVARYDFHVRVACGFLRALATCEDEWAKRDLRAAYPALMEAWLIATDPDLHHLRHQLEARILSGQSQEVIGRRLPMSVPECVPWFETMFFDVRDRRQNPSWIMHAAIAPSLYVDPAERDYAELLKLSAYVCGPGLLDQLIDTIDFVDAEGKEPSRGYRSCARAIVALKVLCSAMAVEPGTTQERLAFMHLLHRIRPQNDTGADGDFYLANVDAMLKALPWRMGREESDLPLCQAEPRAEELMMAATSRRYRERLIAHLQDPQYHYPQKDIPSAAELGDRIADLEEAAANREELRRPSHPDQS
jgi:hypothetical protein